MRIIDLLDVRSIQLGGSASGKKDALDKMVDLMAASGKIDDVEVYRAGVYAREEEGTTGIGEGIAIPHCKSDSVNAPGLAAMTLPDGVEFDSLDGEPANLIFLIAAPNTKDNVHLDVLSKLSTLLMDEDFTDSLRAAKTTDEFLGIIDAAENPEAAAEKKAAAEANVSQDAPLVLAVTGCPTGIAHTYMAAEAIEKKALELGYRVKVETRGSSGAKNVLTDAEIAEAKGIIVAADTKVPMDRFAGKPLVDVHVAEGINRPEELIMQIINGQAPAYTASANSDAEKAPAESNDSIGHQIYTHLMSGVSHMLPFVIGGGIMTALAFLIDTICGFGASGGGNFGSMTPLSALFKYVGGLSMGLMVPVLAGYIAYSIADRPGLAVGFTGGLLASSGNALLESYTQFATLNDPVSTFLMNFAFQSTGSTVSGFLGGLAAGFLAGYVVLGLQKLCSGMPDSLDGIKPMLIYPLGGIFITGFLMMLIFNPLIALVNTGLTMMLGALSDANMLVLMGAILGGMMAIDMGGPINKAAYVFGTGMLATASDLVAQGAALTDPTVQACYIAMAAIMCGGMVPPLGIALACKIFPKKFTKQEQSTWVTNIVMACSFITEGAIPFAAADPARVIPCTFVGAAVAGCLSAFFGCTLMAPHGGIFVFATVGNPLMYIVSWLVGAVVCCLLLSVLKKDADQR